MVKDWKDQVEEEQREVDDKIKMMYQKIKGSEEE